MFAARIDAITLDRLRAQRSVKWTAAGADGIGAFVAEMDFGTAPVVIEALERIVAEQNFGYLAQPLADELGEACATWQRDHYGWNVAPGAVHPLADVMKGLELAITHFSRPGAPIILPTPAYMPFLVVPRIFGRDIIEVPMHNDAGRYSFDLEAIDAAYRAGGDLLVLCNPCNPLGRVFERAELAAVTDVVDKHGGRVFADEIHAPIVYPGTQHVPYAATSDTAAAHAITATSASKGWNLPGLKCAQLILSNDADRQAWEGIAHWASHGASTPGVVANIAAYRHGQGWLTDALDYLDGSRHLLGDLIREHLPQVRYRAPDGTYLAWLDFRAVDLPQSPGELVTERAKVVVIDGPQCGAGGAGFLRLNFATPRPVLIEIVRRMAAALS